MGFVAVQKYYDSIISLVELSILNDGDKITNTLLGMIDKNRSNDYEEWRKVGVCLFNINKMQLFIARIVHKYFLV